MCQHGDASLAHLASACPDTLPCRAADYLGYRIAKYKLETVEVSDFRVLRMQEILLAIKLVKFYTWEKSFAKQVSEVRPRGHRRRARGPQRSSTR